MTRDKILELARTAGGYDGFTSAPSDWDSGDFVISPEQLERFAALVAAAEREACKGTYPALSAEISAEYPQFSPRWPNHAAAMADRIFHEARGIMGTENYGQEEALRMAILHVMRAYSGSKGD